MVLPFGADGNLLAFLSRFTDPAPKQVGKEWVVRCPAHTPDDHPSLNITQGSDGRLLLTCRSHGCSAENVCKALGVPITVLFPHDSPGHRRGDPVATHVYRDEDGQPLYRAARCYAPPGERKRFKLQRPVAGGWADGISGVRRVPYRLPELLAAAKEEPVFIPEGEKDADSLARIGLTATTNPTGASKWSVLDTPTVQTALRGRRVVILPDNDEPGESHARDVAARLQGIAASVQVLRLSDLPAKGDVSDWLARGGTRERLLEMAATAPTANEAFGRPSSETAQDGAARPRTGSAPCRPLPRPLPYRPFPVEALPPTVRPLVEQVAASIGCDPAFAALPALTVAGAAAGGAIVVSPKRGYAEPPTLWAAVVGDSGTAKSPAADPAVQAAERIEDELAADHKIAAARYEAELAGRPDKTEQPPPPAREYFTAGNITLERLIENLSTSPRGLLVHRDELAEWFGGFVRYRGRSGGSDASAWLSMFDGRGVSYQRRTGQPRDVRVKRALVSVFGGVQPDILRAILVDPSYIASGLAGRIVFAMPPKRCPRWSESEVRPDAERAYLDLIARLKLIPFDPQTGPVVVKLSPSAKELFRTHTDALMRRAEDLDGGPMAAALPKLVRVTLRMALIHHSCSAVAAGVEPEQHPIGDGSMRAATALSDWFGHEAERVYATLGERDEDRDLHRLAELVERKGGAISPRGLMLANRRRYPTSEAAEAVLDALAVAGWGRWEDVPSGPAGGRPTRVLSVRITHHGAPPGDDGVACHATPGSVP